MTKQPVLTDFPHTVFATAKRRAQATIQKLRSQLTRSSLSGYAVLFEDVLPASWLTKIDPTSRQRAYGHLPVFWAWVAQILQGNASCAKAASLIQSWCRTLGLPAPKSGSSAYCLARKRIQTPFLKKIDARIQDALQRGISERDLWRGHVLKAIDGTSINLDDTAKNQEDYPQNNGQKPGCGQPKMGLVGLVNPSHGGLVAIQPCRPSARRALYRKFINDCAGHTLELWPYRQEPRAIKRRPKNYQMLTKHRHLFKEIPHRESYYRKPSKSA